MAWVGFVRVSVYFSASVQVAVSEALMEPEPEPEPEVSGDRWLGDVIYLG